jgi:hypothetical protein
MLFTAKNMPFVFIKLMSLSVSAGGNTMILILNEFLPSNLEFFFRKGDPLLFSDDHLQVLKLNNETVMDIIYEGNFYTV